jgi:DNA-binding NarL/FixJ family response regulator
VSEKWTQISEIRIENDRRKGRMQLIIETRRKTPRNSGAEFAKLSRRDVQLAYLVSEGRLNKEIGGLLGITEGTVKVYMSHLFAKLGVGNRAELAAWAARHENQLNQTDEASGHPVYCTGDSLAGIELIPLHSF